MLKKYLQNVLVFKQIFETAFDEKFLVPSGSKNENIILDGFDLNEAENWQLNSLQKNLQHVFIFCITFIEKNWAPTARPKPERKEWLHNE